MKKTVLFGTLFLLAGCAGATQEAQDPAETENNEFVPAVQTIPAMPCSYSCMQPNGCMHAAEPVVLKPRVVETVKGSYHKRRCCPDEPALPGQEDITYVPDAPEIYIISANRTVNSMQKEAAAFFEQIGIMKIYIDEAQPKSDDLPGGTEKGTETLKNRFANMSNIIVTPTKDEADYVINSVIDWFDTPTKKVPAIKYDLFLNEKSGRVIGEWSEIIHQAEGDRSWW